MTNLLDCNLIGNEFELQWRYYAKFQTNDIEKSVNPLTYPAMDKRVSILLFSLFCCARSVVVIVVGNGHGDTSSNPGRD